MNVNDRTDRIKNGKNILDKFRKRKESQGSKSQSETEQKELSSILNSLPNKEFSIDDSNQDLEPKLKGSESRTRTSSEPSPYYDPFSEVNSSGDTVALSSAHNIKFPGASQVSSFTALPSQYDEGLGVRKPDQDSTETVALESTSNQYEKYEYPPSFDTYVSTIAPSGTIPANGDTNRIQSINKTAIPEYVKGTEITQSNKSTLLPSITLKTSSSETIAVGANHNIQLGNTSALSMMPLNPQHIGSTELDVDSKLLASSNPLSTDTIALGSSHYIIFPEQSQAPSVEPSFSELSLPKALEPPSSIKSNSYDLKRSEKIKVDSASEKKDSNITSKNIQTNSVERERKTVEIVTLQSNHTNRRSGNTNIYTKEIRRSSDSDSKKNKGSPIQKTNARTSSISKSTPSSPRDDIKFSNDAEKNVLLNTIEGLKQELIESKTEKTGLKQTIEKLLEEKVKLITSHEVEIQKHQTELQVFQNKLLKTELDIETWKSKFDQSQKQFEVLKEMQSTSASNFNQKISLQNDKIKELESQLETESQKHENQKSNILKLQEQSQNEQYLKSLLAEQTSMREKLEERLKHIETANSELNKHKQEIINLSTEQSNTTEKLEVKLKNLESINSDLVKRNQELSKKIEIFESTVSAHNSTDEFGKKITEISKENAKLKSQLEQYNAKISTLSEKNSGLISELETANDKLNKVSKFEIEGLEGEFEWKRLYVESCVKITELIKDKRRLLYEIESFTNTDTSKVSKYQYEIGLLINERDELSARCKTLTKLVAKLTSSNWCQEEEISELKGKIEQLRGKVQAIRSQFGVSNSSKSLSSPNVVRSSNRRVEFSNEERETWKNSVSDERNGVKLAWGVSGGETTTTAISPRMLDTLANGRKERHQF